MDRLALCVPIKAGLNITFITQLWPGLRVIPHVELAIENWPRLRSPVIFHERFVSAPVPVFEIVSAFVWLVPLVTEPKLMLAGLKLTVGEFTDCDTAADVLLLKLVDPP